jgi:hypothetical protein
MNDWNRPLALIAGALALAAALACEGTPNLDRRKAYLAGHPSLDPIRAAAIREGRVEKGMSPDEVRASVGQPLYIRLKRQPGPEGPVRIEIWIYPGPVVRPSVAKSAADAEFLIHLRFENGMLKEIREI